MKREAALKSALFQELKRQLPEFRVLQYATAGAPDRSIVGGGFQSNWECKHGCPTFISPGNQELFCMRLAVAGHCRYILWTETANGANKRTLIIHPRAMHERASWTPEAEAACAGFNHRWLVDYIKQVHHSHVN